MAEGVLQLTGVAIAVATTGVAGPSPDEDGNPVGRIVVAIARAGRKSEAQRFDYGECACDDILNWTVDAALMMLARHLAAAPE
jgi:nicotinamide mononucleotide (NMN) deamidase PncC